MKHKKDKLNIKPKKKSIKVNNKKTNVLVYRNIPHIGIVAELDNNERILLTRDFDTYIESDESVFFDMLQAIIDKRPILMDPKEPKDLKGDKPFTREERIAKSKEMEVKIEKKVYNDDK